MKQKCMIIFDRIIDLASILAAAVLLFLVISISVSVLLRYGFDCVLLWLFDTTEVMLGILCFLLATWVLRREKHARITLVVHRLKPRVQHAINGITSIIMAIICAIVVYYSLGNTIVHFKSGIYTAKIYDIPTFILDLVIAVGFIPLFIQCIRRAKGYFDLLKTSEV